MSNLPVHDILVLIAVGSCTTLIAIWSFGDIIRLALLNRSGADRGIVTEGVQIFRVDHASLASHLVREA